MSDNEIDIRDAFEKVLGQDVFTCTRSWQAWSVGTMTDADFELATQTWVLEDLIEATEPLFAEIQRLKLELAEREGLMRHARDILGSAHD